MFNTFFCKFYFFYYYYYFLILPLENYWKYFKIFFYCFAITILQIDRLAKIIIIINIISKCAKKNSLLLFSYIKWGLDNNINLIITLIILTLLVSNKISKKKEKKENNQKVTNYNRKTLKIYSNKFNCCQGKKHKYWLVFIDFATISAPIKHSYYSLIGQNLSIKEHKYLLYTR